MNTANSPESDSVCQARQARAEPISAAPSGMTRWLMRVGLVATACAAAITDPAEGVADQNQYGDGLARPTFAVWSGASSSARRMVSDVPVDDRHRRSPVIRSSQTVRGEPAACARRRSRFAIRERLRAHPPHARVGTIPSVQLGDDVTSVHPRDRVSQPARP